MKKIVLNAGGTGGHFFPAIALGEELEKKNYKIYLITDKRCKKYLTPDIKFTVKIIDLRISSDSTTGKLIGFTKILLSTFKALVYLIHIRPHAVISFGGYPTIPGASAAVLLSIPIIIHEQNSFLGQTNRFFARFAKVLALSYKETKYKSKSGQAVVFTGDVVRASIRNLITKDDFNNPVFRLFVIGGSQSAKIFSQLIPQALDKLLKLDPNIKLQVTQQAPVSDHDTISKIYSELNVPFKLSDFFHNIADEYSNAELAICRAGASTIAELCYIGLPAIFIPYPYAADNHQFLNAKVLEDQGGGWCMEQSSVTPEMLAEKILEISNNREILRIAGEKLQQRKGNGARILADTVG